MYWRYRRSFKRKAGSDASKGACLRFTNSHTLASTATNWVSPPAVFV